MNTSKERYETVLNECADFIDRFPDSKLSDDVTKYKSETQNIIKKIKDEQAQASIKR